MTYVPRNPPRGNAEFHAWMKRMVKAYSRRIGEGDIAGLAGLIALEDELADAITEAVRQLRHEPYEYSWAQIAEVVGVSRQACMQRWGHVGGSRVAGGQPANLR